MDFHFNIPSNIADLRVPNEKNIYYVKHSYNRDEIAEKLESCSLMLYERNPFYLFDYFDIYYALIEENGVDCRILSDLMRSFDILFITLNQVRTCLKTYLCNSEPWDLKESLRCLNVTKMCIYLLVHIIQKIDYYEIVIEQSKSKREQLAELESQTGLQAESQAQPQPQPQRQQQSQAQAQSQSQSQQRQHQKRQKYQKRQRRQEKLQQKKQQQPQQQQPKQQPQQEQKQKQEQEQQQEQEQPQQIKSDHLKSIEALLNNWDSKRFKYLKQLYNLISLPLEILWHPFDIDEQFGQLLCDTGYRILEKMYLTPDKMEMLHAIFIVFDMAINSYQHFKSFPTKLLQIIQTSESAGRAIMEGFNFVYTKAGNLTKMITIVFPELIENIITALTGDLICIKARNCMNFLIEFSLRAPKLLIPFLYNMCNKLLDCKYHIIRSGVLHTVCEVVSNIAQTDELMYLLCPQFYSQYLGNLIIHMNDISPQVRCAAIDICYRLKKINALPISVHTDILSNGAERLEDKMSTVRKSAVQLIVALFELNPFMLDISLHDLRKYYKEHVEKLKLLEKTIEEDQNIYNEVEQKFSLIQNDLLKIIESTIKNESDFKETIPKMDHEQLVEHIPKLLNEGKLEEIVSMIYNSDHGEYEDRHKLDIDKQCIYFFILIQAYVLIAHKYKNNESELIGQKQNVEYLECALEFHETVYQTLPQLNKAFKTKPPDINIIFESDDAIKLEKCVKGWTKAYGTPYKELNNININHECATIDKQQIVLPNTEIEVAYQKQNRKKTTKHL